MPNNTNCRHLNQVNDVQKPKCEHLNQVNDDHEGILVCTDCGLILHDQIFLVDYKEPKNEMSNEIDCFYLEYINRLNLPEKHLKNIQQNEYKKNISEVAGHLYKIINETSSITLKEIVSVTGVNEKKLSMLTKGTVSIVDKKKLLDKYCSQLELNFKQYTVIKEKLKQTVLTGHNPLTIIASCIFEYIKEEKIKISLKKICQTVGISCISVQRFLKNRK